MPRLSFEIDWVDAEGIRGTELSATWAALQIRAGDSVVTRVLDARAKTVRDYVYVPIYPFAEWLATNWWLLTHEFGSPTKEGDPEFHRRHSLGANREGYAFPSLEAVSSGSLTHLAWKRDRPPRTRVEFLDQGDMWMDSDEFRECCADLIDTVIRRLVSLDVAGTLLQEEWDSIQTVDDDEVRFCETAAGMGWDPYALDDPRRDWVLLFADKLGELLGEAIPAVNAEGPHEDWSAVVDTVSEAKRFKSLPLHRLHSFRHQAYADVVAEQPFWGFGHVTSTDAGYVHPWRAGYECARRLRQHLDLDCQPLPTTQRMAEALGEDVDSIEKVTKPPMNASSWPGLVDGVITQSADGSPAFAFRRLGDDSRRFHFCRALAEVLLSPGSDTLLTRAYSERQQRNRAFAAEFLAPSSGLRSRISRRVVDADDIDELAAEYGVSPYTIEHQIKNHRIARLSQSVDSTE